MPTYLYRCPRCEREMTVTQPITQMEAPMCFEEHSPEDMEIVIQPTAFILKGSNWAKDGYGGKR